MKVLLAENAGFCFGVKLAVDSAIKTQNEYNKKIYTLGPLIHNSDVVNYLEENNIYAIDINNVDTLNKDDVIFTFDTHQNNYLETQEGKNLPIEHCIKNSDGWKLYGKVNTAKKEHDICIEKTTFGSLELGNYLKDKNYQNVTLVGVVSNICVLSNAVIVKSALPETPIFIDVKGISSNDLTMQVKAISILENLQFNIINK